MEILGLKNVLAALKAKGRKVEDDAKVAVIVGYTQNYAVYVHENLQAIHPVGQAKFLEQAVRELNNSGELARIIANVLRAKGTMEQALTMAGLRIQRDSQLLCPVDTGALKGSAFTRKE